jgi:transcriptional regulator with XRE-family HTH domain
MSEKPNLAQRRETLGALLRSARIRTGHSRVQCANSLNVTTQAIVAFEAGKSDITVTQLQKLARFFELPIAYFLSTEAPGSEDPTEIDEADIAQERMLLRQKLIGVQLRSARTQAGKTQRDCAGLLRVSTRNISEYERGIRDVPLVELEVLSRFLEVPLTRFIEAGDDYDEDSPAVPQKATVRKRPPQPPEPHPACAHLSPELQEFVAAPVNALYLHLALKLSQLPTSALREIGEALLEITY